MLPRPRIPSRETMEEKRPLRRQSDDHHFWSLTMLAVTTGEEKCHARVLSGSHRESPSKKPPAAMFSRLQDAAGAP